MFDNELNDILEQYDKLSATNANVSNTAVAKTYFVQDKVSGKMNMIASTAVWVTREVLGTLGEIINSENVDVIDPTKNGDANNQTLNGDFCVFGDFVELNYLYNCTGFMNFSSRSDIQAQVNTLRRAKALCKANEFRTVQHQEIIKKYQFSLSALTERQSLTAIPGSRLTLSMEMKINNLLLSIFLRSEVKYNMGNEHHI